MGIRNTIEWMPPIKHPERFAKWSRDVSRLLDYLPYYVATGRKERIFVIAWDAYDGSFGTSHVSLNDSAVFYEQHRLQPFILPDQDQEYEQFIEHLQQLCALNEKYAVKQESDTFSKQKDNFESLHQLFREKGLRRSLDEDYKQVRLQLSENHLTLFIWDDGGGTEPIHVAGPDDEGSPIVTETEVAFSTGYGSWLDSERGCSFSLSLDELLNSPLNGASHTGYLSWRINKHDFIEKAALMRLALHFPDIHVSGDVADSIPASWWEASVFCQQVFGVGDIPDTVAHWEKYVPDDEM